MRGSLRLVNVASALLSGACTLAPQPVIERVAIYQNVETDVMVGGAAVDTDMPLVVGREALMRIFVSPGRGSAITPLEAELVFDGETVATSHLDLADASLPDELDTTLNLAIPSGVLSEGEHRYALTVSDGFQRQPWPAGHDASLVVQADHGPLEVVLVPIVADGFAPYTGPDALHAYREHLLRLLPLSDVELRVREPYLFDRKLCGDVGAINMLATEILALRAEDQAPARSYYYGLFAPAATALDYLDDCSAVLGLSLVVGNKDDSYARGSVGHGFFPDGSNLQSERTLVHEFGHAMGIRHAPCGSAGGTDGNYPHPGAAIGRLAWEAETNTLKDPLVYRDFMSYCDPAWVSDYNYPRLFGRIAHLNASGDAPSSPTSKEQAFRSVWVDEAGGAHWLAATQVANPAGERVSMTLVEGVGQTTRSAHRYAWSHATGSLLLIPAAELRGRARLSVDGRILDVPEDAR